MATLLLLVSLFSTHDEKSGDEKVTRRFLKTLSDEELENHARFKSSCRFHTCFEINNCSIGVGDKIGVYVYPNIEFVEDETSERFSSVFSIEYRELVAAVKSSRYYQPNVSRACVYVMPIDTLSQDLLNVELVSLMLHALPQ